MSARKKRGGIIGGLCGVGFLLFMAACVYYPIIFLGALNLALVAVVIGIGVKIGIEIASIGEP